MDVFTKNKRSWIMSRVKSKNTRPEIIVRSIIHRMGCRFSKHKSSLPGNPDIVMAKHRKIIFVHGCFWHGHGECKRSARPETNSSFWQKKLDMNMVRDKKNHRLLKLQGWKVLTIWECQTMKIETLTLRISRFLAHSKGSQHAKQ